MCVTSHVRETVDNVTSSNVNFTDGAEWLRGFDGKATSAR